MTSQLLIGHHGETIDAIQHLAYRIAFHGVDERKPLTVDAAGYRERRAAALHAVADQAPRRRDPGQAPGVTGADGRPGAQGRARAPEGALRRGDVLRGPGARAASRRRAAGRLGRREPWASIGVGGAATGAGVGRDRARDVPRAPRAARAGAVTACASHSPHPSIGRRDASACGRGSYEHCGSSWRHSVAQNDGRTHLVYPLWRLVEGGA